MRSPARTLAPSPLIYWVGILLLAAPIFYRLTSDAASPRERLILICLLGLTLYGVKVLRDAPLFTFSDELVHAFNANQISAHHNLFHQNPILEVTPSYPGLEGATSAVMKLTGVSTYAAGVVFDRRLPPGLACLALSPFPAGQRLSQGRGPRRGDYTGNFNFLYWGAQFSYESLALPLLMLALWPSRSANPHPRRPCGPGACR